MSSQSYNIAAGLFYHLRDNNMKKQLLVLAALAAGSGGVYADNVTVYGIVDAGVNYYSRAVNANGTKGNLLRLDTGVAQGNRLGFKGSEDLGGGLSAFFTLENGFNLDNGTQGQGALFGRQSFVGLQHANWGTVSAGRQYDFLADFVGYSSGQSVAGGLAWGLHADSANAPVAYGPLNNRLPGERVNNSIKYVSPSFNGVNFGALYGFGEVAGKTSAGRTISAKLGYTGGGFSTALGYTEVKSADGSSAVRVVGLGANYKLGQWTPFGVVTQIKDTATSKKLTTYDVGVNYAVSPALVLSGGYQYQKRNQGVDKAQQLVVSADYFLSKRTDVYVAAAYNNDKGYVSAAALAGPKSDGSTQSVLRVGLRHKF